MVARVVIGANFGDEGKGLVTDYLCAAHGAGAVVRFNGGAQAGHTVVTPDGKRHVFSHFGSGSLQGVPTFLSEYFVANPILYLKELKKLTELGIQPKVYASASCLITTFADMMINQAKEDALGTQRHGSCGVGFNETIVRSQVDSLKITLGDLWDHGLNKDKLVEICTAWAKLRAGKEIPYDDELIEKFAVDCAAFAMEVKPGGDLRVEGDLVFEGAQGLLLDQNLQPPWFPHLTRSNTGLKNAKMLCDHWDVKIVDVYYVSRSYLTRHGAGPLPGEDPKLSYHDNTNVPHGYQGSLRFAPLNWEQYVHLRTRCYEDFGGGDYKLVLTHHDQCPIPGSFDCDMVSFGPTREDVVPGPTLWSKQA